MTTPIVEILAAVSLILIAGIIAWMLYVAIRRHYRNRGWPKVDRRKVSRRKIDRREMNRIEREYQKDREE